MKTNHANIHSNKISLMIFQVESFLVTHLGIQHGHFLSQFCGADTAVDGSLAVHTCGLLHLVRNQEKYMAWLELADQWLMG